MTIDHDHASPGGQDSMDSRAPDAWRDTAANIVPPEQDDENLVVTELRSIYGTVLRLRFEGDRAYMDLDDHGVSYSNIECHTETGKNIAPCIGHPVKLNGEGSWECFGVGDWRLKSFFAYSFLRLSGNTLVEDVNEIRERIEEIRRSNRNAAGPATSRPDCPQS